MKFRLKVSVLLLLALMFFISGCARTGSYGEGLYRGSNSRWHAGYHTIRHGDTLYSIAFQYGIDYRELARWNGIGPPYRIFIGQKIRLIPGQQPVVPPVKREPAYRVKPVEKPVQTKRRQPSAQKPANRKLDWKWPTNGKLTGYFSKRNSGKKGIEISGKKGQAVYAAESGTVVYAGSGLRGYGQLIILKHDETYISAYAHNSRIRVKEEQKVKKGQRIADMGNSGSDVTMLHFEIRRDGKPVNPLKYLPRK